MRSSMQLMPMWPKPFSMTALLLSLILWALILLATLCSLLGNPVMKCFSVPKKIVTFITAGCFVLAGIVAITAYSWYTNAAMNNYVNRIPNRQPANPGGSRRVYSQWDLGWAMWVGFLSATNILVGGLYAIYVASSQTEVSPSYEGESSPMKYTDGYC